MARIRSIHPGLFTDESFMSASMSARLLIMGVWCEAWDDGIFEWKPVTLKAKIFPVDNVDTTAVLSELEALNFICRFSADGKPFGAIRNFCKWQRPKKPNSSGSLPQELRIYVGYPASGSELVPNLLPTISEKPPQREEVGGRREDEDGKKEAAVAPARTRSDYNLIETECRKAAGSENSPSPGLMNLAPILGLLDSGFDLEGDILPAIRRRPNPKAGSWSYFLGQIQDYRAERLGVAKNCKPATAAPAAAARAVASLETWRTRVASFVNSGLRSAGWMPNWGPQPGRGGCEVPAAILAEFPQIAERFAA